MNGALTCRSPFDVYMGEQDGESALQSALLDLDVVPILSTLYVRSWEADKDHLYFNKQQLQEADDAETGADPIHEFTIQIFYKYENKYTKII